MPNPTLAQMGFLDEDTQQEVVYDIEDSEARSDISALENKIGSANGIAELDGNGMVPAYQLPSYVDDVLEGTAQNVTETAAGTFAATGFILKGELLPCTPEDGKTYVDTTSNIQYRWTGSGTNFVSMGSNLTLGETANTAYAGNKGKANADAIAAMKDGSSIDSFGDVETALAGKVDKVQGKGLSTNDYDNTAKGIVDTVQDNIKANTKLISDTVGFSGKQLIPFPYRDMGITSLYGVTIKVNSDGSITLNGTYTNTSFTSFGLFGNNTDVCRNFIAKNGGKEVIASLESNKAVASGKLVLQCYKLKSNQSTQTVEPNNSAKFTVTTTEPEAGGGIYIVFNAAANGYNFDNVTIKPMIRDANILDDTYEPYFGSTAFPRSEQAVLGAKNRLTPFLTSESKTTDNAIFTVNSDGTVDLSTSEVGTGTRTLEKTINLTFAEDVILSGCPANGGLSNYQLDLNAGTYADTGEGVLIPANTTLTKIRIRVASTYNNSNAIRFKPMIRLATDPDDTYVPYAMTNRELTGLFSWIKEVRYGSLEIPNDSLSSSIEVTLDTPFDTDVSNSDKFILIVSVAGGNATYMYAYTLAAVYKARFNVLFKNISNDTSTSNRNANYMLIRY